LALEIRFFMSAEDERELLRRLEPLRLELWPVFTEPGFRPRWSPRKPSCPRTAYYLAVET